MAVTKKTVALVGFADTSRDQAPWDNKDIEIWSMNHAHSQPWMVRYDRIFQLHTMAYLKACMANSEKDRKHFEWLSTPHDFPIYTQKKYPEFPAAVRYPIEKARNRFGNFFTSTMAYMIALAIMEGYKRIELYGFEMESGTEYKYQRDSAEYFIGLAQALGIDVYLPSNCSLLKGKLYAYDSMDIGARQLLDFRAGSLDKQLVDEGAKFNEYQGYYDEMSKWLEKYPELIDEASKRQETISKQLALVQTLNGAYREVNDITALFDKFYENGGV